MIQSVWKNLTGLIPAEHLWCDFKWAKNSSPNTNDLYIHYMDKSTGTPSSLITKHQWLVHMDTVISYTSKIVAKEVEIKLSTLIMFPSLLPQFGSAFFSSKEGGVPVLLSI